MVCVSACLQDTHHDADIQIKVNKHRWRIFKFVKLPDRIGKTYLEMKIYKPYDQKKETSLQRKKDSKPF